jgi:hypothetical protein
MKLHSLYAPAVISVVKSRRMKWVGHLVRMEDMRNAYKILVGKPGGEITFGGQN